MANNSGPLLSVPCVTGANGNAAGLCTQFELVCFDPVGATVDQAFLYTVTDCDPLSPTAGDVILAEYRDVNNITVQVFPNTAVIVCPGAAVGNVDIENRPLCDRVVASVGVGNDPDLITLTEFFQVTGYDTATGAIVVGPIDLDALGAPYTVIGQAVECPEVEQRVTPLCEYDPATQARIGEFDRITYNEVSTGHIVLNQLGLPFYDLDIIDPSTFYTLTPGTITRDCQNEVDCDNDPCVSTFISNAALPANGGTTLFSSFQLDPPLTTPGQRWKIDFFEQGADPLVLAQLTAWMTSGPGGVLPPEDEIFVWRGLQGGPAAFNPTNPATPLWSTTPFDLIIPGWAVTDYVVAGGGQFVNIWVDLLRTNPQLCDLTAVVLDPINYPGITIDQMITTADGYFADALANLNNASQPFPVANNATPEADIYRFTTGNPIQADSVVLCKTLTTTTVCFTEEDEPLIRVAGINPVGQTVFEFFKTVRTGAIVVPQGDPIDCTEKALESVKDFCGDCASTFDSNVTITGTQMLLSAIDAAVPTGFAHRIQDNGTNISTIICNFLNTADPRDVLRIPVSGNVFLGNQTMVIPRWMVTTFDCATAGEVFFSIDINEPHPDGCPDPFNNVPNLAQYIGQPGGPTQSFTRFFLNTTTGTFAPITIASGQIDVFQPTAGSGESLRVVDCCTSAQYEVLCDVQLDGSVVEFIRNFEHLCSDGSLVLQADRTIDAASLYTVTGTVQDCAAVALTTCDEDACTGLNFGPITTFTAPVGTEVFFNADFAPGPYNVTINYPTDLALANELEACLNAGGFYAFIGVNLLLLGGPYDFAIGGTGVSNVVNNGLGQIDFTFDPQQSQADVLADCPATSAILDPLLNQAENLINVLPFLGNQDFFAGAAFTGQCATFAFSAVPVPAQRVEVCNLPTTECGPCVPTDATFLTPALAVSPPAQDNIQILAQVGSTITYQITDGAAPTGLVAAIQTWFAGTEDVFVFNSVDVPVAGAQALVLIRDKVLQFTPGANDVTIIQEFAPSGQCNLNQVAFPPPAPPGFVLSGTEDSWLALLESIVAAVGFNVNTALDNDPLSANTLITFSWEDREDDALKVKLCDIDMLADAIAQAQAGGVQVQRRGRVTEVVGGTNLNINTLNACSVEFIVLAGTATYDGITFNVGEGAKYGSDANDTLIEDAGTGIGSNGTVRIFYTELF